MTRADAYHLAARPSRQLLQRRLRHGPAARTDPRPRALRLGLPQIHPRLGLQTPLPLRLLPRQWKAKAAKTSAGSGAAGISNNWKYDVSVDKIDGQQRHHHQPRTARAAHNGRSSLHRRHQGPAVKLPVETWLSKKSYVWTPENKSPIASVTADPDHSTTRRRPEQ